MSERIADNSDLLIEDTKRKARRRLVGAIVLALAAAIILPMLLEKEPRPLGDDVSVQIPPVDEGKFVNRLTGKAPEQKSLPKGDDKWDPKGTRATHEPKADASSLPANAGTSAPATASESPSTSEDPSGAGKPIAEAEKRVLAPPARTSAPARTVAESDAKALTKAAAPEAPAATAAATQTASVAAETNSPSDAAAPTASSTAPAALAVKSEGYVVQLAAYADDKGANSLANKLKKVGYAAYVEPVQTSRGTLWRVRVAGYASRPEADAARVKLKGEGYSGMVAPAK
jgi:DedD protein